MGCRYQSWEDVPGEKPDLLKGGISYNNAGVDKDENGQNDGNNELPESSIGETPGTSESSQQCFIKKMGKRKMPGNLARLVPGIFIFRLPLNIHSRFSIITIKSAKYNSSN